MKQHTAVVDFTALAASDDVAAALPKQHTVVHALFPFQIHCSLTHREIQLFFQGQ